MNRTKVILSIFLMLFLLLAGLFSPFLEKPEKRSFRKQRQGTGKGNNRNKF